MNFAYLKYPWGSAWCGMMLFVGEKNILLDSAVAEALSPFLENELAKFDLKVKDIDIVANSHFHADHVGMNEKIAKISNAEIMSFRQNLQDNSIIDGGDYQLQVIHTPGHTADSVSFLELSKGILFTGDAFEGRGSAYAGVALYEDPCALLTSIEKVKKIYLKGKIKQLYLGHAYSGTCGVLEGTEILEYLKLCYDTVMAYDRLVASLAKDVSIEKTATLLQEKFAVSEVLLCRKAAEITAKAKLKEGIIYD